MTINRKGSETMPSWKECLQAITVLAIVGFALVIVSGFWHVLALLTILAVGSTVILWFWRKNHPHK
jgi:energy-converting hydrogenase Eha subunit E